MILPNALEGIPDLEQFYETVDKQIAKLNLEIEQADEDMFFEHMSEQRVKRWEAMLDLTPKETDTLSERRFAVQSRVVDKLPYSYRIILSDLHALDPDATMVVDWNTLKVTVGLSLASQSMAGDVQALLERKLPLNMLYEITIIWNTWSSIRSKTWGEVKSMTWYEVKANE